MDRLFELMCQYESLVEQHFYACSISAICHYRMGHGRSRCEPSLQSIQALLIVANQFPLRIKSVAFLPPKSVSLGCFWMNSPLISPSSLLTLVTLKLMLPCMTSKTLLFSENISSSPPACNAGKPTAWS